MSLTYKNSRQSGMGLIEALIALVIISIGLLGIAALQITSLQQSSSANWHSQAVWYSYEMTDRINANRASLADYDGIDTAGSYTGSCSAGCTPAQMVDADALEWKTLVSNLPQGRGFVNQAGNLITVSVVWDDGADATNCDNGEKNKDKMTCFAVTMQ